jgi:hypothetical protein
MSKHGNVLSRDDKAHAPKNRPERIPFGQSDPLSASIRYVRKGFHPHNFVDRPGEIESALAAGYTFVSDDNNKKITTPAGGGLTHYLMEIVQGFYDEDMEAQQKANDAKTRSVNTVKDGHYSPGEHKTIAVRDIEDI